MMPYGRDAQGRAFFQQQWKARTMIATLPQKIADPNTPEWHKLRKTGFGASDSAPACGLSPYKSVLHLYLEKTGEIEPVEETDAMRLGKALEPVIQGEFEHRTGIKTIVSPMGLYRSEENPFMLATPDALLETNELGEWKSTTFRRAAELGDEDGDSIPADWLCQTQQQMYVTGLSVCHVAVLLDGRNLKCYRVERNNRLIEGIISAEKELWERIENRDPPEPNWEHSRTPQLIRDMYGIVEMGVAIELSEESVNLWQSRKILMGSIREAEKQADELKAKVLHEIGNASGGILPGTGKMVRRKQINKDGYWVKPQEYIEAREVNVPKGLI